MRSPAAGPRKARGRRTGIAIGLAVTLTLSTTAPAQVPAAGARKAAPPPAAKSSLARFVPREGLGLYVEFDGFSAHAEAWRKTAAYRLLNETSLGRVLEDLAGQLIDRLPAPPSGRKPPGAEAVGLIEHLLRAGFVLASNARGDDPKAASTVLVLRDAAGPATRASFGRLLASFSDPAARPRQATKAGRTLVIEPKRGGQGDWAWWIERTDLIVCPRSAADADLILATLDGRQPSAVDHPMVAELVGADEGFRPVLRAAFDAAGGPRPPGPLERMVAAARQAGVRRLDLLWGFQGNTLMTVARASAPDLQSWARGHKLPFDKGDLPPIAEDAKGFVVASLPFAELYDLAEKGAAGSPGGEGPLAALLKGVRDAAGPRLRAEVLPNLGPRVAVYVKADRPASDSTRGQAGAAPPIPTVNVVIESKDIEALGKALDRLLPKVNQALKSRSAPRPARRDEDAPAAAQAPAIKPLAIPFKGYALTLPEGALPLSSSDLQPTLLLGKKWLVISTTNAEARKALALEERETGRWGPGESFAGSFDQIPSELLFLSVGDPRETLAGLVAQLPTIVPMLGALAAGGSAPGGPAGRGAGAIPVDRSRLPASQAIRDRLFPGWVAAAVVPQGIYAVSREAFPDTAVTTNGVLLGLVLPAVQAAREVAHRAQCSSNLTQVGAGLLKYQKEKGQFPPFAIVDKNGRPLLSWRVALLPYLGQGELYKKFKLDEPWDGPTNSKLLTPMPEVYASPNSTAREPGSTYFRAVVGPGAALESKKVTKVADLTDGASTTLVVAEAAQAVPWTKPDELRVDRGGPLPKFGEAHSGGFHALLADGTVRLIATTTPERTLRALISRAGGEDVPDLATLVPVRRPVAPPPPPPGRRFGPRDR